MVTIERRGNDSVRLWSDDRQYLVVSRTTTSDWEVRRHINPPPQMPIVTGGVKLDSFSTADEAIAFAQNYLESGEDELNEALRGL